MNHDVVIAGGGPVGLFLACELRLAGVSVLVLEQAEALDPSLKGAPFGLRGLSAPSLEAFHRRSFLGDIERMAATSPVIQSFYRPDQEPGGRRGADACPPRTPAGHFAGIQFFQEDVDASRWTWRLPTPVATRMAVYLDALEPALAARAEALGADIRRGFRVDGIDVREDGATVSAGGQTVHGRWLVGCDGGRSAVRKLGGFAFEGTEPEFTGYSVQVEIRDPDQLRTGRNHTADGLYIYTKPDTIIMGEFDGGRAHRAQPLTRESVQAVLRRVSGVEVDIAALKLATTWTDRAYQATTYRRGRVLLAGDAAHIHSPLGGQGLNLGLGDAMNLGWKLAATIRGEAPDDLLETYANERIPVGAAVLDWSRAQVAVLGPGRSAQALRAVVRDVAATRDGATYLAERIWGVGLRYDLDCDHPLVGRGLPDFALADGRRAGALLQAGHGLLLDFGARAPLEALARRWAGRITYVGCHAEERLGLEALLVRPDGVVAWISAGEPDMRAAEEAAARWFGRRPSPDPGSARFEEVRDRTWISHTRSGADPAKPGSSSARSTG